jgi:hypothetical protein
MRRQLSTFGPATTLMLGRGLGGTGRLQSAQDARRTFKGEGGSWGKQGFPQGTERPAWMPGAEDA